MHNKRVQSMNFFELLVAQDLILRVVGILDAAAAEKSAVETGVFTSKFSVGNEYNELMEIDIFISCMQRSN